MFSIEDIPSKDELYYRVHDCDIRKGQIIPGAFKERGDGEQKGMSTDWSKYSTPDILRDRAKKPKKNGIVSFIVDDLRNQELEVNHAPIEEDLQADPPEKANRAHTNVKGVTTEIRLKLLKVFSWEIKNSNIN